MAFKARAALALLLLVPATACTAAGDCGGRGACDAYSACVCTPGYNGAQCADASPCLSTFSSVSLSFALLVFQDFDGRNTSGGA